MTTDDRREALPPRVADYLATELVSARRDFRPGRPVRSPSRAPFVALAGIVAVLALILVVVGPRFAVAPGASGQPGAGGPVATQPVTTDVPPVAERVTVGIPDVRCGEVGGNLTPEGCDQAIELVRAGHPVLIDAADRIVIEDSCGQALCDRAYPFDAYVSIREQDGSRSNFHAYGLDGFEHLGDVDGGVPDDVVTQTSGPPARFAVPSASASAINDGVRATVAQLLATEGSTWLDIAWTGLDLGTLDPPSVATVVHDDERLAILDRATSMARSRIRLDVTDGDVAGHWMVTIDPVAAGGAGWTLEFDVVNDPPQLCDEASVAMLPADDASPGSVRGSLTCEAAIAAATELIGPDPRIYAIEFHHGSWCAPRQRCAAAPPNLGHVRFLVRGQRPDTIVNVSADDTGAITTGIPFNAPVP